jgi:hypothetical protein
MHNEITNLRASVRRWTLILGVAQITIGCLVGLIPPSAVPWFRGIVMAHIEFVVNGVLVVAFGLLVSELQLRTWALKSWFVLLQVGTWSNGAAGLVAGLTGFASILMPTLVQKFPPPAGPDHWAVTGLLQLCGATILAALGFTLWGLVSRTRAAVPG